MFNIFELLNFELMEIRKSITSRMAVIYFILLIYGLTAVISMVRIQHTNREVLFTSKAIYKQDDNKLLIDSLNREKESILEFFNTLNDSYNGLLSESGIIKLIDQYLTANSLDSKSVNTNELYELIKQELEEMPFYKLPVEQRRFILNLNRSFILADSIAIKFNMLMLNDLLVAQNDEIKKLNNQLAYSIPLGIAGLLVSIFSIYVAKKTDAVESIKEVVFNITNLNSKK